MDTSREPHPPEHEPTTSVLSGRSMVDGPMILVATIEPTNELVNTTTAERKKLDVDAYVVRQSGSMVVLRDAQTFDEYAVARNDVVFDSSWENDGELGLVSHRNRGALVGEHTYGLLSGARILATTYPTVAKKSATMFASLVAHRGVGIASPRNEVPK